MKITRSDFWRTRNPIYVTKGDKEKVFHSHNFPKHPKNDDAIYEQPIACQEPQFSDRRASLRISAARDSLTGEGLCKAFMKGCDVLMCNALPQNSLTIEYYHLNVWQSDIIIWMSALSSRCDPPSFLSSEKRSRSQPRACQRTKRPPASGFYVELWLHHCTALFKVFWIKRWPRHYYSSKV